MSDACNQSCSTCSIDCSDRKEPKHDFTEHPHELSKIKKVIGVVSGKGGVGKSLVTSLLAVTMNRRGHETDILDADVTGPSLPKSFGTETKADANELGIFPVKSKMGTRIMSINLLLPNDTDPVVWRGPMIAGAVKQFWTDVIWGDVDYMFIDMPPGTGDVPLTVFQSLPVDGIVVVTSPQELVSMIVTKASNMAKMMNVPILGIVENMSYLECPDCGKRINVFGESKVEKVAADQVIEHFARVPIDPNISSLVDNGAIEQYDVSILDGLVDTFK